MTAEEYKHITLKRFIPENRIKQIPFSSRHKTFGDYAFDIILIIDLYKKGLLIPEWLVERISIAQHELFSD